MQIHKSDDVSHLRIHEYASSLFWIAVRLTCSPERCDEFYGTYIFVLYLIIIINNYNLSTNSALSLASAIGYTTFFIAMNTSQLVIAMRLTMRERCVSVC